MLFTIGNREGDVSRKTPRQHKRELVALHMHYLSMETPRGLVLLADRGQMMNWLTGEVGEKRKCLETGV